VIANRSLRRTLIRGLTTAAALFCIEACQTSAPVASPGRYANSLPKITALEDPIYDALQGVKAQALSVALSAADITAAMHYTNNVANQPDQVVAAVQVLLECEQARAARSLPSSPCELRRKGDVVIHSTAELTVGLTPEGPALLWRLQNPAASAGNVYIAGSIHVLKPNMQAPPSYSMALRAPGV